MGWSYSLAAGYTMGAIRDHYRAQGVTTSNSLPDGGFYEESRREHKGGAITGMVFRMMPDGVHCLPRGSFKIAGNGRIVRFPSMDKATRERLFQEGQKRYRNRHMAYIQTWQEARAPLLGLLHDRPVSDDTALPDFLWRDVENVASLYQQQEKVAFLAMPRATYGDVRTWLCDLS